MKRQLTSGITFFMRATHVTYVKSGYLQYFTDIYHINNRLLPMKIVILKAAHA